MTMNPVSYLLSANEILPVAAVLSLCVPRLWRVHLFSFFNRCCKLQQEMEKMKQKCTYTYIKLTINGINRPATAGWLLSTRGDHFISKPFVSTLLAVPYQYHCPYHNYEIKNTFM